MTIKYAGDYHGPSYGNPGYPSFEGFTSIEQAVERFRERQETTGSYPLDVTELDMMDRDMHVIVRSREVSSLWPATTPEDEMELHRVSPLGDDGLLVIAGEPFCRLKAGPRGGVVRENY